MYFRVFCFGNSDAKRCECCIGRNMGLILHRCVFVNIDIANLKVGLRALSLIKRHWRFASIQILCKYIYIILRIMRHLLSRICLAIIQIIITLEVLYSLQYTYIIEYLQIDI